MLGIYYFADRIILILFGEAWYDAIPFLKVLVFIGLFEALYRYEVSLLKSLGYTKLILRLEIVKKVFLLLGIFITYDLGIIEMLYSSAIVTLLIYLFSLNGAINHLRLSFFSYLESFIYVLLAQVVLVVLLVVASKFGFDWVALLVFLVFGIISYRYFVRSLLSDLRNLSVESK
jgi:O-antigen/teichoic acid export membrane protein